MTASLVLSDFYGTAGAVRVLTMNRPEARNALSTKLIEALHAAHRRTGGDEFAMYAWK
jgi:enoyl-CoA hydratase/carnithine racemase